MKPLKRQMNCYWSFQTCKGDQKNCSRGSSQLLKPTEGLEPVISSLGAGSRLVDRTRSYKSPRDLFEAEPECFSDLS